MLTRAGLSGAAEVAGESCTCLFIFEALSFDNLLDLFQVLGLVKNISAHLLHGVEFGVDLLLHIGSEPNSRLDVIFQFLQLLYLFPLFLNLLKVLQQLQALLHGILRHFRDPGESFNGLRSKG